MERKQDHNQIIRQAAREVLGPLGLFQRGQSRLWIDDNGWYFTLVEFQPSSWSKSADLNVAPHFLWCHDPAKDWLTFDYRIGGAVQPQQFAVFTGDEAAFHAEMTAMAQKAAEVVWNYRAFRDLGHARKAILSIQRDSPYDILAQMMICGLTGDPSAQRYRHSLIVKLEDGLRRSPGCDWESSMLDFVNALEPFIHDPVLFQGRVVEQIQARRQYLLSKPSYKKLSSEPYTAPAFPPKPPVYVPKKRGFLASLLRPTE